MSQVDAQASFPMITLDDGYLSFTFPNRHYRLQNISSFPAQECELILKAYQKDHTAHAHSDTINLHSAESRMQYCTAASTSLHLDRGVIADDLNYIIIYYEEFKATEKKHSSCTVRKKVSSDRVFEEAEALLHSPNLIDLIQQDFHAYGLVGATNVALCAYLGMVSRLTPYPCIVTLIGKPATKRVNMKK